MSKHGGQGARRQEVNGNIDFGLSHLDETHSGDTRQSEKTDAIVLVDTLVSPIKREEGTTDPLSAMRARIDRI